MNIFSIFYENITNILLQFEHEQNSNFIFTVEVPNNPKNGDLATNAAMIFANHTGQSPKRVAESIATELSKSDYVLSSEVAGPGFVNIKLTNSFWQHFLRETYLSKKEYGDSKIGKNQEINIEFVSANPTGPMHVGHARSAIYGDALAKLLSKCGFKVTREYYINDAGKQIDTLIHSLFIRYKQELGIDATLAQNSYPGEYLIDIAKTLVVLHGNKLLNIVDAERDLILKKFAVDQIMKIICKDMMDLGVIHDKFTSEKCDILEKGLVEETLKRLQDADLIYSGVLEAPKSKTSDDWESTEQTIFRATKFGDDADRPIVRSDGSYTYFALDAAYHLDKLNRGFSNMLLLLGADHGGYTKRIKAIVSALSNNEAEIHVIINQLVNLMKDGKPFKMSKRAGNFLTVQDILSELDKDLIRFGMLSRKNDTVIDLDFTKMKEQSKDNHIFYIQYASARAHSVLLKAKELGITQDIECANLERLVSEQDMTLIKKIAIFPKVVESAAKSYEIFRIPYYLYDLATTFHQIWGYGTHNAQFRFIVENDRELTAARLILIQTFINTMESGLDIIGIKAVESM